jgi:GxxExxY protein
LESAYEECLCFELKQSGISHFRQVPLPVVYKDVRLDCGYRMDIVVDGELALEVKAVERVLPIHEAQMLTYLRLSGHKVGLLMNFNSVVLKRRAEALCPGVRILLRASVVHENGHGT